MKDIPLVWVESVGAPVVEPASWEKPSVDPEVAEVLAAKPAGLEFLRPRRQVVASEVGVMHQELAIHSPSEA